MSTSSSADTSSSFPELNSPVFRHFTSITLSPERVIPSCSHAVMLSLASQFEQLRAQQRRQESMIAELQSYASQVGNDFSVIEGLRMLDCLSGLGAIRGSVQDTCSTPEQTNRLKRTNEKADRLQKDLDLVLRRHICESTRSAASKDENDILVALLSSREDQDCEIFAGQSLDLISGWATGADYTGIGALSVREMVVEYIGCVVAVVDGVMEFSIYRPTPPLPPLGDEGDREVKLTTRRSFRNIFRKNW